MMLPIQNLRLAWFSSDVAKDDAEKLYVSLFKEEPERSTSAKQPTLQNPFLETVGGALSELNIEIQRQLGRIDLLLSPFENLDSLNDGTPNLLDTASVFSMMMSAMQSASWMPKSQRVAVVAPALSIASSILDARTQFATYIGHDVGIPEASDHFFQINRKANLGGVKCNRIIQLSVTEVQKLQISFEVAESAKNLISVSHAFSISHDFNTVPSGQSFDIAEQRDIFVSLFAEIERAMEIGSADFLRDNSRD